MEVELSFGTEATANAEQMPDGKMKPGTTDGTAISHEVVPGEVPAPKAPVEPAKAPVEGEAPKPAEEEKAPPAPLEDLGEYKADDTAVVAKFDARYFTPEGTLNRDALSNEFWGNEVSAAVAEAEGKPALPGKLNDSTYAYLANRLGVSKEMVNEIEAGLVAKASQGATVQAAAVYAIAGAKERYDAAIAWGRTGYTDAQRARFDDVVRGQKDGWEDAVTALMARFDAANPGAAPRTMPNLRRSSPARDVTDNKGPTTGGEQAPAAVAPFADEAAYHQALREAGRDNRKHAEVRARLRVSPFVRRQA